MYGWIFALGSRRKLIILVLPIQTYESYGDKWDIVKLTHEIMTKEEEQEREEALAEVVDPLYLLARADADADAEGEVDDSLGFNSGHDATSTRNAIVDALAIDVFGE